MHMTRAAFAFGLAVALAPSGALAEQPRTDPGEQPARNMPRLYTPWGTSISAGGGVIGFADGDMRDFADIGGAWNARLVIGTREMFAVEAAYVGAAMDIDALGLDTSARLVANGLEATGRINLLQDEWQPYALAGVGWRHYSLTNEDFNTSSVAGSDDVFEIPLGAGVSYRYRGLVVDARGMFRAAFDNDLVDDSGPQDKADLHNWTAELTAGWEF